MTPIYEPLPSEQPTEISAGPTPFEMRPANWAPPVDQQASGNQAQTNTAIAAPSEPVSVSNRTTAQQAGSVKDRGGPGGHIRALSYALAAMATVAVIAGGGLLAYQRYMRRTDAQRLAAAEQQASRLSANDHFAQALTDLQAVIGDARITAQQTALYDQLAVTAANAGHPRLAIEYYQRKHDINPGTAATDADILGDLYQRTGQNAQAIAQYKLYIAYVRAHPQSQGPYSVDAVVAPITATIQALEAKQ